MKVYLVYKLTNLVNGKIYVGCHETESIDDGYMGSGKRLTYAKRKYGVENFKKEILSVHQTPEEMFAEEARIVNTEFLARKDVYNLTKGGSGSWFHVRGDKSNNKQNCRQTGNWGWRVRAKDDKDLRKKISTGVKRKLAIHGSWWTGKKLTEKHRQSLKDAFERCQHQQGSKNSQFGSCWVTLDSQPKKIKLSDLDSYLKQGWKRGRK